MNFGHKNHKMLMHTPWHFFFSVCFALCLALAFHFHIILLARTIEFFFLFLICALFCSSLFLYKKVAMVCYRCCYNRWQITVCHKREKKKCYLIIYWFLFGRFCFPLFIQIVVDVGFLKKWKFGLRFALCNSTRLSLSSSGHFKLLFWDMILGNCYEMTLQTIFHEIWTIPNTNPTHYNYNSAQNYIPNIAYVTCVVVIPSCRTVKCF